MNCNQVFNILTRGPFPAGEPTDNAVELHLAVCSSCRRLAEALRPTEVFQEAVGPEEGRGLPGYWGQLAPVERPVLTAPRRRAPRRTAPRWNLEEAALEHSNLRLWQFVAAVALGIVFGLGLKSMVTPTRLVHASASEASASASHASEDPSRPTK